MFRITITFILFLFFFSSCSLQKRRYLNGYHFQRTHSKKNNCIKKENNLTAKETEINSELVCSANPKFEAQITGIPLIPETNHKISVERKERRVLINHIVHKIDLKQENYVKKPDKVNKATVNIFSLISILLIPVFFVSLFISSAAASVIVFSCLIIGPILAILGATVTNKKQRNWMVGLSLGFWLLFVLYALLLIYIL